MRKRASTLPWERPSASKFAAGARATLKHRMQDCPAGMTSDESPEPKCACDFGKFAPSQARAVAKSALPEENSRCFKMMRRMSAQHVPDGQTHPCKASESHRARVFKMHLVSQGQVVSHRHLAKDAQPASSASSMSPFAGLAQQDPRRR